MITIEQLEALANQVESDDATERARLLRICKAMVRIVAAKQPEAFRRRPTSCTDESGHYDNSYPPKAAWHYAHGAPRLVKIEAHETDDIPTSDGFYHNWRRETEHAGCYVAADGSFYGCTETGTGSVGSYAAHPGDCHRDVTLEWDRIEPTLEQLRATEVVLRALVGSAIEG